MAKKILLWSVICIVILGALIGLAYWGQKSNSGVNDELYEGVNTIKEDDHFLGDREGKVVLVEYSDFQCPACASFEPTVDELIAKYGSQFTFVYRHFPLRQIHKNAHPAGRASEAAGIQGKFWEYHAILFEKQLEWSTLSDPLDKFTEYAVSLGLDEAKFKSDYAEKSVENRVDRDEDEAFKYKVDSTPTFFLNGKKLKLTSFDGLRTELEQVINQQ